MRGFDLRKGLFGADIGLKIHICGYFQGQNIREDLARGKGMLAKVGVVVVLLKKILSRLLWVFEKSKIEEEYYLKLLKKRVRPFRAQPENKDRGLGVPCRGSWIEFPLRQIPGVCPAKSTGSRPSRVRPPSARKFPPKKERRRDRKGEGRRFFFFIGPPAW